MNKKVKHLRQKVGIFWQNRTKSKPKQPQMRQVGQFLLISYKNPRETRNPFVKAWGKIVRKPQKHTALIMDTSNLMFQAPGKVTIGPVDSDDTFKSMYSTYMYSRTLGELPPREHKVF